MEGDELIGSCARLGSPPCSEPAMRRLPLTPEERGALIALRDAGPNAYLRERAGALLQIADGQAAAAGARTGLLRPRQPDAAYRWLDRCRAEGIAGSGDR